MIDVTDLFDAFHRVAATLWREFGNELAVLEEEDGVGFDVVVDGLEMDLFLPACARRLREATGEGVDPDEIAGRIRLVRDTGEPLAGSGGSYHSHAFHPDSAELELPSAVLAGNLMSVPRAGIRLQLDPGHGRGRLSARRRDLLVH